MSSRGMVWARQQRTGKAATKALLLLLGELCDEDGRMYRSQRYLAETLECGLSTVKGNLSTLEQQGFITREKRRGGGKSLPDLTTLNIETFVVEPPVDPGGDDEEAHEPESGPCENDPPSARIRPIHEPESDPSMGQNRDHLKGSNLKAKQEKTTTTAADATAEARTAQTLLAEWIDHCSPKPPSRVTGQMAREIKNLLAEGISYDAVRDGLIELHRRGTHPSTLPSFVHTNQQRHTVAMQPSGLHTGGQGMATGTQRAMEALAAGQRLQQQAQLELGGNQIGSRTGQRALGEGSTGGQSESGRSGNPDVVGNPRPFVFQ
jgi:biotin operon repressor